MPTDFELQLAQRVSQLEQKMKEVLHYLNDPHRSRFSGEVASAAKSIELNKETPPPPIPAFQPIEISKPPVFDKPVVPQPMQRPIAAAGIQSAGVEKKPAAPQPSPPSPARKLPAAFDWESLIGVKLFSWIAGVALLLAAVFFLRYSINQGWLMPPVRMAIGILAGIGLLVSCEIKAARKYPVTANAMDASAIAILFSTFFAAHALWDLIGALPAFALLVLVAALAVFLSIKRDSMFIALLGLVGGFAAPALLSTGENRPISLFTYILLLNAGLAWVGARKKWPLLNTLSLIFTVFYQWSWVVKFLSSAQLPTALGIFLVFPVLAFVAVALGRQQDAGKGWASLYGQTANLTALLPVLFGFYAAAVPGYGDRYILLFSFLFLIDAGLLAIAIFRRQEIMHLLGAVSTILIWSIWLTNSYDSRAWPGALAFIALFFALYLVAPFLEHRFNRSFVGLGAKAQYAAPLLLFAFPAFIALEPGCAAPGLLFAVLLLFLLSASAVAIHSEKGPVYFAAAFFALVSEATWSFKYLNSERMFAGLVLFIIFGLFYIGVPVIAGRFKKHLWPQSGIFLGLGGHVFLLFFAAQNSLSIPPWPFLGALLILDLAIGCATIYTRQSPLFQAAMAASGLLLMVWAACTGIAPWPKVAILAALALSFMGILWIYLSKRRRLDVVPFVRTAAFTIILSQIVSIIAALFSSSPGAGFLVSAHLIFLVALLGLAAIYEMHFLAVLAFLQGTLAVSIWQGMHLGLWPDQFLFAAPVYLVLLANPFLLGTRLKRAFEPCIAAVLASAAFFFQAWQSFIQAGWENVIGILPVAQAILLGFLLTRLMRMEPKEERSMGRLALVAGAALAFVTVAIPLQLEKEWITIGWALEAAALAWLFGKIPHKGLLCFSSGLFAAALARLVFNPAVLTYHAREGLRILNWYLYAYLVPSLAMMLGGQLLSKTKDQLFPDGVRISKPLPACGAILIFLLLNIEIADFYSVGPTITFNFSATLAQDLTYTLAWAVFAVCLLGAGIVRQSQPARIASLALLSVTIFKCFIFDLKRLSELYRVASFFGLALCLALVALALQNFVLSARKQEK